MVQSTEKSWIEEEKIGKQSTKDIGESYNKMDKMLFSPSEILSEV